MSRRFVFRCDVCGQEREKSRPDIPSCWADVTLHVTGFSNWISGVSASHADNLLLCPSCQIILQGLLKQREKWLGFAAIDAASDPQARP